VCEEVDPFIALPPLLEPVPFPLPLALDALPTVPNPSPSPCPILALETDALASSYLLIASFSCSADLYTAL
jgi:hypothetical protein